MKLIEGDIDAFFDAPFAAYGRTSTYASPMRSDIERFFDSAKNPLLAGGAPFAVFAVRDGAGALRGRICAHLHPASNVRYGERRACFGFFDCADDRQAAATLLGAAEAFARKHGCDRLAGNFNLTAMQQIGVMTGGFENAPYTDMVWGPPHLPALLEANGFAPTFPMTTFEVRLDGKGAPEDLISPAARALLTDPKIEWAPIDRRRFDARMEDARLVLNAAFDANPMFVPVTAAEYRFQAQEMMWILDPRLACVARVDGEPVGAVVCIPDLNPFMKASGSRFSLMTPVHLIKDRLTRSRAVVIYYAVAPAWQGRGLNAAMLARVMRNAKAAGYRSLGVTWIADVNAASLRQMARVGARPLHRLQLYEKALS